MNRKILISILLLIVLTTSCSSKPYVYKASRLIMDTLIDVKISGVSQKVAKQGAVIVFSEFDRIDKLMSRYKPQSVVTALNNRTDSTLQVDNELYELLKLADDVSRKTEGAFDVTLEPVIRLYNLDERDPKIPDDILIALALSRVGYQHIHFTGDKMITIDEDSVRIDLGGIAKGYALKRSADLLLKAGIKNFLINAGGDIITHGVKQDGSKWRLGIQNPRGLGIKGVMRVTDTAVVTSGDYERFIFKDGKRFHHILDPSTGRPASLTQSVTAIYPDPVAADAYATAIFVLGPEKGLLLAEQIPSLEVLIIAQDGTIVKSRGFSYEAK